MLHHQTRATIKWDGSCPSAFRSKILQDTINIARAGYDSLDESKSLDSWSRYQRDTMYDALFDAHHRDTPARKSVSDAGVQIVDSVARHCLSPQSF